jgi:hypothetical protein
VGSVREEISRCCHGGPKRARSWKQRTQPRKAYSLPGLLYSERWGCYVRYWIIGEGKRGEYVPRSVREWPLFRETLISIFGSSNPLPLGRDSGSRIDHHLVNGVPTLSDDKLQVQVGKA